MTTLQQFGIWRTGTNYLKVLTESNFPDVTFRSDGKHGPVVEELRGADGFLVQTKHPLSWLLSYRRWTTEQHWDRPVRWYRRVVGDRTEAFRNQMWLKIYALAYQGWRGALPEEDTVWVRYEDLLLDLEGEMERLRDRFDLPRPEEGFQNVQKRVDSGANITWKSFDPTYYTEQKWIQDYDLETLEAALQSIDVHHLAPFFEDLGYSLEEARAAVAEG